MIIELRGRITEDHRLEVTVPDDLPPGEVIVTLEVPLSPTWTTLEIDALLNKQQPRTGAEIVALMESGALEISSWEALNIDDPVAWVRMQREEQVRKRGLIE
jgi:hypothetical protein